MFGGVKGKPRGQSKIFGGLIKKNQHTHIKVCICFAQVVEPPTSTEMPQMASVVLAMWQYLACCFVKC